jgi:murein DD-endopeptidase MepM/ murein hydrolase activator NlpD
VPTHIGYRINAALERYLPERRLFLKSDTDTRFIRLRPATQAIVIGVSGIVFCWTVLATAILILDGIGAGSARDQTQRQQSLFEERLTLLSTDRDLRVEEAARAQERFNLALDQVSTMQAQLLASEDRRRELENGVDVIHSTLSRTIAERDAARDALSEFELAANGGTVGTSDIGRARDAVATVALLTDALGDIAVERDAMEQDVVAAHETVDSLKGALKANELRSDAIFAKLEEAVTVSMEPLDKMFRAAGLSPEELIEDVRRGYSGQGGPLTPISVSTSGSATLAPEEVRANAILNGLDRMNLYRLAAVKTPFAMPVTGSFRWTSGFGTRNDPKGAGRRMHEGTDMAGAYGMPIFATADGVVIHAGWDSGYGRLVKIQHEFGIETRYGHLSQVRVEVGQRVSRGDRIGDMGNSGRSTGTHLHYEIRIGGTAINPMTYIKAGKDVF